MKRRASLAVAVLAVIVSAAQCGENDDDLVRDRKQIQGSWSVLAYDLDGKSLPADILKTMTVTIQADKLVISPRVAALRTPTLTDGKRQVEVKFSAEEGKKDEATYRLDVSKKGRVIELTQDAGGQPRKLQGAYALDGDALTIWLPLADRKLPKKLPTSPTPGVVRLVLRRMETTAPDKK
jgi:uncharacterized protein (TIGR03067 family)